MLQLSRHTHKGTLAVLLNVPNFRNSLRYCPLHLSYYSAPFFSCSMYRPEMLNHDPHHPSFGCYFSPFFILFSQKSKVKNRGVNEIWTDAVIRAAGAAAKGSAPKAISGHLVRIGDLGNVPRQEKKFKVASGLDIVSYHNVMYRFVHIVNKT